MAALVYTLPLISLVKCITASMSGYIVNGRDTKITGFPHSAFLKMQCSKTYFSCGSSILNQAILITAANCLDLCISADSKVYVWVGSETHRDKYRTEGVDARIHDYYNTRTLQNDIAVVKLKNNLKFQQNIRRVAILKKRPKFRNALIASWGWNMLRGRDRLKYTNQDVWNPTQCKKVLGKMPEGSFCAEHRNRIRYPTEGDAGSALVVSNYIQIGVYSYQPFVNNRSVSLAVYTDVSYYYRWIVKNIKTMLCHLADDEIDY